MSTIQADGVKSFLVYVVRMQVVLFRHGEKSVTGSDPELTASGKLQAQAIAALVAQKKLPPPTNIASSPRLRAQQTFSALSEKTKIKIKVQPELDQQLAQESSKLFRLRIQEYLVKSSLDWKDQDTIYLCSHHDWIMEFLSIIECDTDLLQSRYFHWQPGQYMVFDKKDIWHLVKTGLAQ